MTFPIMELKEDKVLWFRFKRRAKLAKSCGSVGGRGVEIHGKECRKRIRAAVMCDNAGQQRLRPMEERLAPAASAARAKVAQEAQVSLARAELAQESRDEKMSEACVTNNAENVKTRVEILGEDSTEAISRMEDGNTPVEGPLVSAKVNNRPEGVSTSRQRRSEKTGAPGNLTWGVYTKKSNLWTLLNEYGFSNPFLKK